jgi:hypothetical protein
MILTEIIQQIAPVTTIASFCLVSMVYLRETKPDTSDLFFYAFGLFFLTTVFLGLSYYLSKFKDSLYTFADVSFFIGILILAYTAIKFFTEEKRRPYPFR